MGQPLLAAAHGEVRTGDGSPSLSSVEAAKAAGGEEEAHGPALSGGGSHHT